MSKPKNVNKDQITKNQHFLPNFLIRRWKNEKNEILIVNDSGEKILIPCEENNKYFSKKDLYEKTAKTNFSIINNLEKKLQKIEEKYAKLTENIIKKVNDETVINNLKLNDESSALIEIFTHIQMFRTDDYWKLLNKDNDEMIDYLNELVESYYSYTQMSEKTKTNFFNDFWRKRKDIELENLNWDQKEYKFFKLYTSPKYVLVHALKWYYYEIIPFSEALLPIANLGKFKISSGIDDDIYFYLIPISPSIAIFKKPKWPKIYDCQGYLLFNKEFGNLSEAIRTSKGMMYAELSSTSKYSVVPHFYNNYDIKSDYELSFKNSSSMRIMDDKNKRNWTYIDKWNLKK